MNANAKVLTDDKLKNIEGLANLDGSGSDSQEDAYIDDKGGATGRGTPPDSHRTLAAEDAFSEGNIDQQQAYNEDLENESNKTGLIDEGTMNVFGFNDDLNLDDRIIV